MGIRFSTRVGKRTSVSFPLWTVLAAVFGAAVLFCAIARVVAGNPWVILGIAVGVAVIAGLGVLAFRNERRQRGL